MKTTHTFKVILFSMISVFVIHTINNVNGQNIAITDDEGYTADPSAMLDVKSVDKGLLIPRLTTAQRTAVTTPATGLLVYDTDLNGFYYYNGADWDALFSGNETDPEVGANTSNYVPRWDGAALVTGSIFDDGTNLGIGNTAPDKRLHIKAGSAEDGIVLERASAGANTRIQFQNEGGVNQSAIIYQGASDDISFTVQGTDDVLRLKNNGY
ncbi:MAG: hypothetical protein KJ607_11910, partial [Bacteroidetes bacterium]|nr:hypothetical protein [Bacteroidota bacterium]